MSTGSFSATKGVTLELLWLGYRAAHPEAFLDYAGPKFEVVDRKTGEVQGAMVFVGVLGAPNYTFVDVTRSRSLPDWTMSHVRMFEFGAGAGTRDPGQREGRGLNEQPFKKTDGSRRSWFEDLDRPALKPLPAERYEYVEWRKARVNIDYHIQVAHALYSVPHPLGRCEVDVRLTAHTGRDLPQAPPGRRTPADPQERRIRDRPVAHARRPPRPCGLDSVRT